MTLSFDPEYLCKLPNKNISWDADCLGDLSKQYAHNHVAISFSINTTVKHVSL